MMSLSLADELALINKYRKQGPVNVEGLVEALGLRLNFIILDAEISGILTKDGETFTITVNEKHSETRRRFTIAHELGHYMLHRNKIGDGIEDTSAYRSTGIGKYKNLKIGQKEETQANQFAANLLMPHDLVVRLRNECNHDNEQLAKKLGVSLQALEIRLRSVAT